MSTYFLSTFFSTSCEALEPLHCKRVRERESIEGRQTRSLKYAYPYTRERPAAMDICELGFPFSFSKQFDRKRVNPAGWPASYGEQGIYPCAKMNIRPLKPIIPARPVAQQNSVVGNYWTNYWDTERDLIGNLGFLPTWTGWIGKVMSACTPQSWHLDPVRQPTRRRWVRP
ncbi:hypothetical protein BDD12DRAFT_823037 [Trichophaea hybrida]|nr:hypothetical protein BDD12DRAFT_823037 [Trichophaea hybrida]